MKENEERIYKSIIILFKDSPNIEIFNKKAIYLYMREMTGLSTKQIVIGLKKFKMKYNYFVQRWNRGSITHIQGKINGSQQITTIN